MLTRPIHPRMRIRKVLLALTLLVAAAAGPFAGGVLPAAAGSTAPLDHFLCYSARAVPPNPVTPSFTPPATVGLTDQFASFPAAPQIVAQHCNPVQKTANGVTTPITNPAAHLLCWTIVARPQLPHVVQVSNQFGTADLLTGQPRALCLPTWKSLTGPPNQPTVQPPGLDHFTCYPVRYVGTARFTPPPVVGLRDQFGNTVTAVGAPTVLCLPTQKEANGVIYPITNPSEHLLCFPVKVQFRPRFVFDQNQFGTGLVHVIRANQLCLPSEKKVLQ